MTKTLQYFYFILAVILTFTLRQMQPVVWQKAELKLLDANCNLRQQLRPLPATKATTIIRLQNWPKQAESLNQTLEQLSAYNPKIIFWPQPLLYQSSATALQTHLAQTIESSGKLLLTFAAQNVRSQSWQSSAIKLPSSLFSQNILSLAHNKIQLDSDGKFRREIPFIQHNGKYYLSAAMESARVFLKIDPSQVHIFPKQYIQMQQRKFYLNADNTLFVEPLEKKNLSYYTDADLQRGNIPRQYLDGRIIVLAAGMPNVESTNNFVFTAPERAFFNSAQTAFFYAWSTEQILRGHLVKTPRSARHIEAALLIFLALFCLLFLPQLKRWQTLVILCGLCLFLLVTWSAILIFKGWNLPVLSALVLIFLNSVASLLPPITLQDTTNAKMAALAYYNQGHYLAAWEKLKRCRIDESLADIILDIAAKLTNSGQTQAAQDIYQFLQRKKIKKDVVEKLSADLKNIPQNVNTTKTATQPGATISTQKKQPQIGPYTIVSELKSDVQGSVYIAQKNEMYILQTFWLDSLDIDAAQERIKKIQRLNSKHVAPICDQGQTQEVFYIVSILPDGQTLKQALLKTKFSEQEKLQIQQNINTALQDLRRGDIVHGQIDADTLWLNKNLQICLTQFTFFPSTDTDAESALSFLH